MRREQGFTLVELLIVLVVFLMVLTATLTTFNRFVSNERDAQNRLESVEKARGALDVQMRQLRNLAIRLNNAEVIQTLGDDDFVFQTSDPTRTWVRYCLDTSDPARARLWQAQLALPASATTGTAPVSSSCPGSGWTQTRIVAENVVNRIGGLNRPAFSYGCADGTATTCRTAGNFAKVISASATLYVDTTPGTQVAETRVSSGVYLRNQNQKPIATFTATNAGIRRTILNGSQSSDFEGRTLRYFWFRGTAPATTSIRCDNTAVTQNADGTQTQWGATLLGTGVSYAVNWQALSSPQTVTLVVCDPGDSYGISPSTPVSFATS